MQAVEVEGGIPRLFPEKTFWKKYGELFSSMDESALADAITKTIVEEVKRTI